MAGLDPTGFTPKRLDEILEEVNQGSKDIFGESLNVSPSSPDGQMNGLNASARADLWDLVNITYTSFDPAAAQGTALSRLVLLNGISRLPATKSTAVCTFTGLENTNIPIGFRVAVASLGDIFVTTQAGTIPVSGTLDLTMEAEEFGPVQAEANTLTNIVNPLNGVISVTNALSADLGSNEESDQELRIRQILSTAIPSQNLIDSLYASLLQLDGVNKNAYVYENDTSATDARGLPPHSFNVVIKGGDDTEIAQTIFKSKTPGVLSFGTTTIQITDSQGFTRDIAFSRPILIPIYVTINTNQTAGFPANGVDLIKQAIIDYALINILIGQPVERTRLFTPINSVQGHSVQSLFIGLTPSPTGTSDIAIPFNALAEFLTANIVVNVT